MGKRRTIGMLTVCAALGIVGGAAGAAAACHPGRSRLTVPVIAQPEVDLERAMRLFRRGDFRHAQTILQRTTFEFPPGAPELAQVRYYLAECFFQLGDHVQAASDFRKVADEFPTTEYAPLALLRAGDANLRLWHRPELDPTYGETALAIYQELAGRYPESDAAARARPHVKRLENEFAEKTYKTGVFYFRRKAYDSAIIYFRDVIANYPNAGRAPDALLRLVDSYRAIRYTPEVQETCEHLRRFYPNATGLERSCPPAADSTVTPSTPSTPS
jgi:outer membrane protein assembly factor BamD